MPKQRDSGIEAADARLAWCCIAPALLVIVAIALVPLAWAAWASLHRNDLRMPWLGQSFVGLGNYAEAAGDARFRESLAHTGLFTAVSVAMELVLGLCLALGLHRAARLRGVIRMAVLLPWAIPTVAVALVWRFMFEDGYGVISAIWSPSSGGWLVGASAAWVPLILSDAWKTTPFVALLLLAGLQTIDDGQYEAARIDGAGRARQLLHVTLPALVPTIVVALIFRTLDAFRVFDLIYVLTGGGPGTSTETVALYTFNSLFGRLRFGYGSALSVIVFVVTFGLALLYIRALDPQRRGGDR